MSRPKPRRRWILWAALSYAAILAIVAMGLSLLYRGARARLDEALGDRLLAVATTAVYLIDGDRLVEWTFAAEPSSEFLWLATRLDRIRRENDLAEVTLCDPAGYVISSATGRLERGAENVYWELDRPAVDLALAGFPSVSRLYRSGSLYQKSAHAPVVDATGAVAGVLTIEADADFLDALASLRQGALATGLTVLLGLTALGWLLARISLSLEHSRASLLRQESLAAMGRMTAGIAHEIRNPLGIIRGAGQHLQRVLADRGIEDDVAVFIPEEVDRLDRILTGYLALGTDAPGVAEDCDLGPLARRTLRLVDDELRVAEVAVELIEPLPPAPIRGDPRRLQQVLLNLLLNARDAMPRGGRVLVSLTRRGGNFELAVADEGDGLRPDAAARIFEPFWSTKEKGGGLGLTVSRQIAREHGGELTLANRVDRRGCVATLSLPAREV